MKYLLWLVLLLAACGRAPVGINDFDPKIEEQEEKPTLTMWKEENAGHWTVSGAAHGVRNGQDYTALMFGLDTDEHQVQYNFEILVFVGPPKWDWPSDDLFVFAWNTRKD